MKQFMPLAGLVAALAFGGSALADGAPTARVGAEPVVARLNFVCQGGVRVQLVRRAKTVQIVFAGRSRVVELTRDPGGTSSYNTDFTWVLQGGVGSMKNNGSGQLELSGCRRVG